MPFGNQPGGDAASEEMAGGAVRRQIRGRLSHWESTSFHAVHAVCIAGANRVRNSPRPRPTDVRRAYQTLGRRMEQWSVNAWTLGTSVGAR